jgi:uncharacterized protein (DUF4415 family)
MTEKKRALGSDLEKADTHVIQPNEYEEIPELGDEWFAKAEPHEGGKPVRRGRPPAGKRKQLITLRIDPDIIDAFKEGGPGWQTRMSDVLKAALPTLRERRPRMLLDTNVALLSDVAIPGHVTAVSSHDFTHGFSIH